MEPLLEHPRVKFLFSQLFSVYVPFFLAFTIFYRRTIFSVLLTINPPLLPAVTIYGGRTVLAVYLSI